MRFWPRRRLPQEPAWMHCNCDLPVYGRITHLLMVAHDQTELTPMRHGIAALTVVRKAHRRRTLGCRCEHPE